MKTKLLGALLALSTTPLFAQGEMDAYKFAQTELNGSARYMSMGGAFGALGGDVTAITQNPASVGVYRSSELATTLNLSMLNNSATTSSFGTKQNDQVNFRFNNVGYVATLERGSDEGWANINFGFSFNRQKSFNRRYRVGYNNIETSLTNYIADVTNNDIDNNGAISLDKMGDEDSYYDTDIPWISMLSYVGFLIDPVGFNGDGDADTFAGFFDSSLGDTGNADLYVRERGHIDQYTISLGGNYAHKLYIGAALGIYDLAYRMDSEYGESIQFQDADDTSLRHNANYTLNNYLETHGTGIDFKLGVIARPTNFLRLGAAIHTPTFYYSVTDRFDATVYFDNMGFTDGELETGSALTPAGSYYQYRLTTPWRFLASGAVMLGNFGLISADYEYAHYSQMNLSDDYGSLPASDIIEQDFEGAHTLKLGAEARLTSSLSLRAGYARTTSPITASVINQEVVVETAGTVPNYTLDRGTHYYTCGLGYRYQSFFVDLAYVHKLAKEDVLPYSPMPGNFPEVATLENTTNQVLMTVGFRF